MRQLSKRVENKDLYILAHSAGGAVTSDLLCSFAGKSSDLLPRLRKVAFTDAVHDVRATQRA